MPDRMREIHYALKAEISENLNEYLTERIDGGVTHFKVDPQNTVLSLEEIKKINLLLNGRAYLIIVDNLDWAVGCNASHLLLSDLNVDTNEIKAKHPNLKLGGFALSMADCKNWELRKVDFIEFLPSRTNGKTVSPILGSEGFQEIIPKDDVYGWMILSLNTPVIASEPSDYDALTDIVKNAEIRGIVISDFFQAKESRVTCLERIHSIFKEF